MGRPRRALIPLYRSDDPAHWGWTFAPASPGTLPDTWAWVAEGFTLEPEPGDTGRMMIREPGRESARFAHEVAFESARGLDLTLGAPLPRSAEQS